jgi:ferric-dicitrate binding protein FerR (iron transport regulator)
MENSETVLAILTRLEKIENLLERMDRENRNEEARRAAFDVKWEQLMREHTKIQEHVKENWERLNTLEQKPDKEKARLWETFTGRTLMLLATAIAGAVVAQMPTIIKLILGVE